jgi:hypothetical protein
MDDFQSSTIIMIGGGGSQCVGQQLENLRFHFSPRTSADSKILLGWIEDRKNPSRRISSSEPEEYAIVARTKDTKSGKWRVIIAAFEPRATVVAAKYLLDGNSSAAGLTQELTKRLPAGWAEKNIEAVIAVNIFNGKVGFPRLVDWEVW